MERFPEQTPVTIEDIRLSGWKEAIESGDRDGYSGMWQSLSSAASAAIEKGQLSKGKGLWLLADACSMMLTPQSLNDPFKAMMVMDGKRSALPEDFQDADILLLSKFSEEVDDIWLQARLADLSWLLIKPRNPKYAILAIDAYRQVPLNTDTWVSGGRECWMRAISLTMMLKAGAGERINELVDAVLSAFTSAKQVDGFLALWLADLLAANRLGYEKRTPVAAKLEVMAQEFELKGEWNQAREYFDAASKWHQQSGNVSKSAKMTACVAEGWVKEAVARKSSEQPSHMVAASFYENAIQTYRSIPRSERSSHNVDERVADLHRQLAEAGARSLDEMGVVSSPSIDISALVENARNSVKGKSAIDALAAFANIYHGARVAQIREFSEKMLREHPLQALMSATHMSRDGRVIAKRPGMGFGDVDSADYKAAIWAEMVKYYGMGLGIVVQGDIWPALEILRMEHRLREDDFISLAKRSPLVPRDRSRLFGKALFAGYDNDFTVALHLLVPQIEHMVRWSLKTSGVKTTTLDKDGIENENGLSALMVLPEVEKMLGENLAFEIRALFCDAFGANLRNEIAHGLLGDDDCESAYAIYAWWLGVRLVFNAYLGTTNKS